jgi:hypothetical protein
MRRLTAEGIGLLLLAATAVGSGVMAERLSGGNLAIVLLANTAATVAVLATLIVGGVSTKSTGHCTQQIQNYRALSTTIRGLGVQNILGPARGVAAWPRLETVIPLRPLFRYLLGAGEVPVYELDGTCRFALRRPGRLSGNRVSARTEANQGDT